MTLENDQQIYIRLLIAFHEAVWRLFIPFLRKGQNPPKEVKKMWYDGTLEDWSKEDTGSNER